MIRYYGLYSRHREIDRNLYKMRSQEKQRIYESFNKWRQSILLSFGYDPLTCPKYQHEMVILDLYYNHKRVSLEELYEDARRKYEASHWRSSA